MTMADRDDDIDFGTGATTDGDDDRRRAIPGVTSVVSGEAMEEVAGDYLQPVSDEFGHVVGALAGDSIGEAAGAMFGELGEELAAPGAGLPGDPDIDLDLDIDLDG
jgi:hypothetical protein